jgi:hypothetical protein
MSVIERNRVITGPPAAAVRGTCAHSVCESSAIAIVTVSCEHEHITTGPACAVRVAELRRYAGYWTCDRCDHVCCVLITICEEMARGIV